MQLLNYNKNLMKIKSLQNSKTFKLKRIQNKYKNQKANKFYIIVGKQDMLIFYNTTKYKKIFFATLFA